MKSARKIEKILKDFDSKRELLERFRTVCESLVCQILDAESLQVHSVTSRIKKREKLKEKLQRLGKRYQSLDEVTDLVGLRIITQFEDDVDRIGTVVEREFTIDRNRSIDKRRILDPDRFGYLSLHYICTLNEHRSGLIEFKTYSGLVCEVQIRSILQHAWAEIEHDLGYKTGATVPLPVRRRFSRLAGLLELADTEFTRLRDELSSYSAGIRQAISEQPSEVSVDEVSVAALLKSDKLCLDLDLKLAGLLGGGIKDKHDYEDSVHFLHYVGLETVSDVRKALNSRKRLIVEQLRERIQNRLNDEIDDETGDDDDNDIGRGICLYHLFQVMLAEGGDIAKVKAGLDRFSIGIEQGRDKFANVLVSLVHRLSV